MTSKVSKLPTFFGDAGQINIGSPAVRGRVLSEEVAEPSRLPKGCFMYEINKITKEAKEHHSTKRNKTTIRSK